jgi:hypothetical protein
MSKKNSATMNLVDIENGKTISMPLPQRSGKTPKKKHAKQTATISAYALEPSLPRKLTTGDRIDRTPDELFERVTSGLIQLDNTKRMQAITSGLAFFALRFFAVLAIVSMLFIIVAQFN